MRLRCLLFAFLLLVPSAASAAEALGLKVLGFSPDGRYFGFIQYGGVGDGGEFAAETYVVDVPRNSHVLGMPLAIESWNEDPPVDDDRPYDEWLLGFAEKRFAYALRGYGFRLPNPPVGADEGARSNQTFAISSDVNLSLGPHEMSFQDPKLGYSTLLLTEKRFPWPRSSRTNRSPDAYLCEEEVDWEEGVGLRLALRHGKREIVLTDEWTIPASRHCVLGYGISEIHTFARPDGKVSIAVILGMGVRAFEGNDRSFVAVTAVIDP